MDIECGVTTLFACVSCCRVARHEQVYAAVVLVETIGRSDVSELLRKIDTTCLPHAFVCYSLCQMSS